jgi:hypothetical protein
MTFLGQDKPSLDEVLEHFGVKGMKWGVRRDPQERMDRINLSAVRQHNARVVNEAYKRASIQHPTNKNIREARANADKFDASVQRARTNYKMSKLQYKENRQTMGKTKAKIILEKNGKLSLQKAKARRAANSNTANRETTEEAVNRVIRNILGIA